MLMVSHFSSDDGRSPEVSSPWSLKQAVRSVSMEESKCRYKKNTCTALPVRKETVLMSCGRPNPGNMFYRRSYRLYESHSAT